MKKLFIILFLLTVSFRVAAQNEQTKDSTLLNRFPTEMGKGAVVSSTRNNCRS